MKYLLGVDFGGGSTKATLLDENGTLVATTTVEYRMQFPVVGWAEQDPDEIYDAFTRNVRKIICESGVDPADIVAAAFDAGTHIAVLLDERDQVIRPAIYWSDTRSLRQAAALQPHRDAIIRLSYNAPSTVWTLPQLQWIRENEPQNFGRIRKIMFLKDYIRYRVTGHFATDTIDAMGSMLLDVDSGTWSEWLCSLCGIDMALLPPIVRPDDIIGTPTAKACAETGLSPAMLIAAGATDTVMEVFASGAVEKGQATLKLATAGRICPITDKPYASPLLVCYQHIVPGFWYPGTATKTCASSLRWFRDVLSKHEIHEAAELGIDAYRIIDEAAACVPAGSDSLFFHPYLQGEITPYLDPRLKGSFTGISSFHTKAHFNRAVMEGVAYSLRECLNVFSDLGITINDTVRLIGGGSKSPLWSQIVADVLDIPLKPALTGDSSIGSAMLAGVASGVFHSFADGVHRCTRTGEPVFPNAADRQIYDRGFSIYRRIHDALAPIYGDIYQ